MIYLFLSISCSVTVGVLLKFAKRYQIDVLQAVTWNYLFAIGLSLLFFKPDIGAIRFNTIKPIYVGLGILLPLIFLIQSLAIRNAGLARTDIAQRLSLFISLCAAYFLFAEEFNQLKYIGLILGFLAIILTLYRKSAPTTESSGWIFLLFVFIGFGVIDVLFKMVSQHTEIPYTTSLFLIFCISFTLSLIYLLYQAYRQNTKLQLVNFACGFVLGVFNFGNILFYLKAHREFADSPFIVFATMNLGVIILGCIIGVIGFKEKLSKVNYIGLLMALAAIICITLAKIYAV